MPAMQRAEAEDFRANKLLTTPRHRLVASCLEDKFSFTLPLYQARLCS